MKYLKMVLVAISFLQVTGCASTPSAAEQAHDGHITNNHDTTELITEPDSDNHPGGAIYVPPYFTP